MTKRHFEAFARRIAADIAALDDTSWATPKDRAAASYAAHYAARTFADIAQADNDRFDRVRFLAACGIQA